MDAHQAINICATYAKVCIFVIIHNFTIIIVFFVYNELQGYYRLANALYLQGNISEALSTCIVGLGINSSDKVSLHYV